MATPAALTKGILALCLTALLIPGCNTSDDPVTLSQWKSDTPEEPGAATWQPLVLASPDAIRVAAPPANGSATTAQELQEVRSALNSLNARERAAIHRWHTPNQSANWRELLDLYILNSQVGVPSMSRIYAALGTSINDATIAAWNNQYHHLRLRPSQLDNDLSPIVATPQHPSYPSDRAAVAGAAERILTYFFPTKAAEITALATEAVEAQINGGLNLRSDVTVGRDLGRQVADAVIAKLEADGRAATALDHVFSPRGAVPFFPASDIPFQRSFTTYSDEIRGLQVYGDDIEWTEPVHMDPTAGDWVPFVLDSAGDITVTPPDANSAESTSDDMEEVINILNNRTFYTDYIAYKYANDPPGIFFQLALDRQIEQTTWSTPRAAMATALMNVAIHDGLLACWKEKYIYLRPRPYHLENGMPTVIPTPNHPAYPSGHATCGGVGFRMLQEWFPATEDQYREIFEENNNARVWAGVHYRSDMDAGNELGAATAVAIMARHPLPN